MAFTVQELTAITALETQAANIISVFTKTGLMGSGSSLKTILAKGKSLTESEQAILKGALLSSNKVLGSIEDTSALSDKQSFNVDRIILQLMKDTKCVTKGLSKQSFLASAKAFGITDSAALAKIETLYKF